MRVACIIPAHNEAAVLEETAKRVWAWGENAFDGEMALVISENGSTDGTAWLARLLEKLLPRLTVVSSKLPGKGGAVKRGAASVEADVYLMMDADLSADLASAEALVRAIEAGGGLAIGSRRLPDSRVERPWLRRLATAIYAAAAQAILGLGFRDLQCGCKAFSRRVRDEILPEVRDDGFFFDTELLARAEKRGLPIREIGVSWKERGKEAGKSKVRLWRDGLAFLKKATALRKDLG